MFGQSGLRGGRHLIRKAQNTTALQDDNQDLVSGLLAFWELAAAVRPMFDPQGWQIADSPRHDRFMQFVRSARERIDT
jgi:hypothetical protein